MHLLTPGPVPIPDFVQEALGQSVIPHRSAQFEAFYANILDGLRYLFQTKQTVCTMASSGTGGVEAAMYSLFKPGDRVLVLDNGKFSGRWATYVNVLGLELIYLKKSWGEIATPKEVLAAMEEGGKVKGVVLTHCETSTGAYLDLEEISYLLKQKHPETLIVVDGIASIGATPFYFDAWGIDCAVVASQKALMNPAGVVAIALSEGSTATLRATDPGDYQNLYNYVQWAEKRNYPFTPPYSLLSGLLAVLNHYQEKTLPVIWNQVHQSAQYFRQRLKSLKGNSFTPYLSDSMTAFQFEGRDPESIRSQLEAQGFWLSGGQGPLKGQILRISHMGLADQVAMEACCDALAEILSKN